ncbi:hypothetical protein LCGC14_2915860 [marine sediment metagenome]|uniref:Uncharacterized protein n=1 Tax=marine sediment metagenome TaxID=412755 RepID=A0A0F8ZXW0_9ZZZZ
MIKTIITFIMALIVFSISYLFTNNFIVSYGFATISVLTIPLLAISISSIIKGDVVERKTEGDGQ